MEGKMKGNGKKGRERKKSEGEKDGREGKKKVRNGKIRGEVGRKKHDDKSKDMEDFPPVALVMAESQGNVDDTRVLRLVGTFNREIKSGRVQVIALPHRRNEFQTLHALNYNIERREAINQRDAE